MAIYVYAIELVDSGRDLPSRSSLPTDDMLTDVVLAAGFTHCHGKPYRAPSNPNVERSTSAAKSELGAWPRGRAGAKTT